MDLVNGSPNTISNEAPPLLPNLPQEEFDRMTLKEKAAFAGRQAQAAVARYGGRPELMIQEHPYRDLSLSHKK